MKRSSKPSKSTRPLKPGDLIYLKNVGFPATRTDDGCESWEGASCIVLNPKAGCSGAYVSVAPLLPVRAGHGHEPMTESLFHPENCIHENRPWLKKHLKGIIKVRTQLETLSETIKKHLS